MKNIHWPNCAVILAAALSNHMAMAQSSTATGTTLAAASDPNTPVPAVVYQSVFADSPKGVETQTVDWKKANADVGQFRRGHVDILKWEEANPPVVPATKPVMPGSVPAAPAPTGAGSGTNVHKH